MPSQRKSQSARSNGAKSRGPKTPAGKSASSLNALRHGLTAKFAVMYNESQEDFEDLLDSHIDRYHPADPVELELVHTMAVARWRLRRIGTLESNLLGNELALRVDDIDDQFDSITDDGRLAFVFQKLSGHGEGLSLLIRYEGSLTRIHDRAFKQLQLLQNSVVRNEPTGPVTHDPPPTSPGVGRTPGPRGTSVPQSESDPRGTSVPQSVSTPFARGRRPP